MDKSVLLHMTDEVFASRLKRFGLPLYEREIRKLTKAIAGLGEDKSTVTYPKLVRSMADHILRQRSKKPQCAEVKRCTELARNERWQHLRLANIQSRTEAHSKRKKNSRKTLPKLNKATADVKTTD
ncbi:uncharacterized protein LOC135462144 [Liolophura sinensis]|uniref:uncharacterized protein LOC135462144 n=1 Tax=Liolophura sinensis TaxID=3198878 RepID=UPI003158870F